MSKKVLFYSSEDNEMYRVVKRKSVERKRVLYKMHYSGWKVVKAGMSASEAEAFTKLLGLKLRS